jgi:hypothetical protein
LKEAKLQENHNAVYTKISGSLNPREFQNLSSFMWGGAGEPKCRLRRGDRDTLTKVFIEKQGEIGCRPGGAQACSREPGTTARARGVGAE